MPAAATLARTVPPGGPGVTVPAVRHGHGTDLRHPRRPRLLRAPMTRFVEFRGPETLQPPRGRGELGRGRDV